MGEESRRVKGYKSVRVQSKNDQETGCPARKEQQNSGKVKARREDKTV
jgi:hypothetical protein